MNKQAERFPEIAHLGVDWIWETGPDKRFTYLSEHFEAVTGISRERLIGRSQADVFDADRDSKWSDHMIDLDARRPFRNFEYKLQTPGGEKRIIWASGQPLFDENNTFLGYRGSATDVTREMSAQWEAVQKQQLMTTVLENLDQGVSVFNADLRVIGFNDRVLELLDLPTGLVSVGDSFEKIIRYNAERGEYGAGDVDDIVAERVATAQRFEPHQFERTRPDGTVIEVRGRPLPEGGFVSTYTDVTARVRAERELLAAKEMAEVASMAKSDFLANISHEIRTPLNAILGFSSCIANTMFGPLHDRYVEYANDIQQSGFHLLAVIDDVLDIAQVEAGRIELAEQTIDFREVADSTLTLLEHRAAAAGVALQNTVMADGDLFTGDHQRIRQIMLNLVGNAIKFSPHGGHVRIEDARQDAGIGFAVVDQGIGMDADDVMRAFEPFIQLDHDGDVSFEGIGLGLSLVRRFVDLHDGRVDVDSARGRGTRVAVLFPPGRFIAE